MKNGSGGTTRPGGGTTHLISMVLAGLALMASAAWADPPRHGIHSAEVPGGVAGALVVAGSPAVPERARFVVVLMIPPGSPRPKRMEFGPRLKLRRSVL